MRARFSVLMAAVVVVVGGCAIDPTVVPLPGTTVSGPTYRISIEFSNALNLPEGARVIANGVDVGNLVKTEIVDAGTGRGRVVAEVEIMESVELPVDVEAELRQATPLGDVHISLDVPTGSTGRHLKPHDTIPLKQTEPATQVEDTLSGLATATGSGMIGDFQSIVRQLNSALPNDPVQTERTFAVIGDDLIGIAENIDTVGDLLHALKANTEAVTANQARIGAMVTEEGVEHITEVVTSLIHVIFIFSGLGPLAQSASWLAPLVQALDDTTAALVPVLFTNRPLDLDAPSNLRKVVDLLESGLLQIGEKNVTVDVERINVSGEDRTRNVINALRMVGVVR